MSFHSAEELIDRLKRLSKKWHDAILYGHGTVEECSDELDLILEEAEDS